MIARTLYVFLLEMMACFLFYGSVAQGQTVTVALASDRWVLSQRNFKIPEDLPPAHNGELVEFLGRKSFRMARGLAYLKDVEFQNGTIEVDMAAGDRSRFFGIAFHVQSDDAYEV